MKKEGKNKLWIRLNTPSVLAGQSVSGSIELDTITAFSGGQLTLKVFGEESVKIDEMDPSDSSRTVEHTDSKTIVKASLIILRLTETTKPGHHSFPFSFRLSSTLPGSFSCRNFSIKYTLQAQLTGESKFSVESDRCPFDVRQVFTELVKPIKGEKSKSFAFCDGSLSLLVILDRDTFFPGESMTVIFKANNTSTKKIERVKVVISARVEAQSGCHSGSEIILTATSTELPKLDPFFYGTRYFRVPIPKDAPLCAKGKMTKITYLVTFVCVIANSFNLEVSLPFKVIAPQQIQSTVPLVPPNGPLPSDIRYRPPWQPDEEVNTCPACQKKFGILCGRHHCKHCGKVFCNDCTANKLPIPKLKIMNAVRVCNGCLVVVKEKGGQKYQSKKQVREEARRRRENVSSSEVANEVFVPDLKPHGNTFMVPLPFAAQSSSSSSSQPHQNLPELGEVPLNAPPGYESVVNCADYLPPSYGEN